VDVKTTAWPNTDGLGKEEMVVAVFVGTRKIQGSD
jgi:hypothetical protein